MGLYSEREEYDQRQLRWIQTYLIDYKNGRRSLVNLDVTLKSLVDCLLNVDQSWKDTFFSACLPLLMASDFMVYSERPDQFSDEEERIEVLNAIDKLIKMVEPLIEPTDEDL
jgi:hypothetical protein